MKKPNILFLMVDQLRPDHAGFMPGAKYQTPHLDALAAEGTVFSNCQSVHPVCMPARAALLTGRYPHPAQAPRSGERTGLRLAVGIRRKTALRTPGRARNPQTRPRFSGRLRRESQ